MGEGVSQVDYPRASHRLNPALRLFRYKVERMVETNFSSDGYYSCVMKLVKPFTPHAIAFSVRKCF